MARCAPQTLSVSLEVTLVTFPPFSAPKGETHGRHLASASGPGTSVLKADLVVMSSLPLSGATASPPSADALWPVKLELLISFCIWTMASGLAGTV